MCAACFPFHFSSLKQVVFSFHFSFLLSPSFYLFFSQGMYIAAEHIFLSFYLPSLSLAFSSILLFSSTFFKLHRRPSKKLEKGKLVLVITCCINASRDYLNFARIYALLKWEHEKIHLCLFFAFLPVYPHFKMYYYTQTRDILHFFPLPLFLLFHLLHGIQISKRDPISSLHNILAFTHTRSSRENARVCLQTPFENVY